MIRSRLLVAVAAVLSACVDSGSDAPARTEAPPGSVVVGHRRELRGAWISSVFNGTWPSRSGLAPSIAQAELITIFDVLQSAGMNAVFLQVRPESDALYQSTFEPWSRFLTGTQGEGPGWDPLAFAVTEGHRRGLEVHAWLNPYRARAGDGTLVPDHIARRLPDAALTYGAQLWMDPGVPAVRTHILDVVREIVLRYDVDGIHFDDYFYPYPVKGVTFGDARSYASYKSNGGTLARDDWRRSNVDTLVRETGELVARTKPSVRFGISPFGIYRPGTPAGITGLDAYATLYCDPVRWMDQGWVDYVAPQLYWPTTQAPQAFGVLAEWWSGLARGGRSVFIGHDATQAGKGAFTLVEYERQMESARGSAAGSIYFSAGPLVDDTIGLRTKLAATYWATPAATPPLATVLSSETRPAPTLERSGAEIRVPSEGVRSIAVYKDGALDRLVPVVGASTSVTLSAGTWAVSTLDRRGHESFGAPLTVP